MDQKLVSNFFSIQSLPENYIFPPETRPGKLRAICKTIPVIDLGEAAGHYRAKTIQEILQGSQEFGFFQVINHGVSENLMNDTMSVFKEFFAMPAEDKASVYSEDPNRSCRLYTGSANYATEEVHVWRDILKHPCHPLEECIRLWPGKPARYREVVGAYSIEAKKIASRVLDLISEGLGLESGYFGDKLSEVLLMSVNFYPPCPEPSLTLGLPKHCDPSLITILLQGNVYGLQVFKDGEWIGVEPLPNAFVIFIGYQLQIISNNKLKSAEHRVVTNSTDARTTAALFVSPACDCIIGPAKALTNACNPPLYRNFKYREFLVDYSTKAGDTELVLEPFKVQA